MQPTKYTLTASISQVSAPSPVPQHEGGVLGNINLWIAAMAGIGAITVAPLWSHFKEKDRSEQTLLETLIANLIKRDAEFHAAITQLTNEIRNLSSKLDE
jgi:hypothetical protein